MASTEEFLLALAAEENLPVDRVRPIVARLNQEWYDTAESLRRLSIEDMEKLSVPHRLAKLIFDRLNPSQPANPPVPAVPHKGDSLAALVSAGIEDPVDGGLAECITTLQLVVVNILRNPGEEKYTRLKLSNPGVAKKLGRFPAAVDFLRASGFAEETPGTLVFKGQSHDSLHESLGELNTVAENLGFPAMEIAPLAASSAAPAEPPLAFDPFKAQMSSLNPDNPRLGPSANDPAAIARKMELLRKAREEEARKAQVNRDPVVLLLTGSGNVQAVLRQLEQLENERLAAKFGIGYTVAGGRIDPQQGDDEEMGAVKAVLKENEENSKFHSKRKVELSRLERQRSYTSVTIRVRFPDRYILQGTFSSVESTLQIYEFVASFLETPTRAFTLYVAPPKQVIESSERRLLKEFAPATLMNFAWKELRETGPLDGPFLLERAKAEARSVAS